MYDEKMKTGDFAKLCHVDKKTLFYYDEINLLKPAFRLKNGYRYYTSAQYDQMNLIKILQAVGLSLDEISYIMKTASYEKRAELLSSQLDSLDKKIQELTAAKAHLEKGLSTMHRFIHEREDRIFKETQEDSYYKIYPIQSPQTLAFLNDGYEYGVLYDPSSNTFKEQCRPDYYFHTTESKHYDRKKPAGQYICMFHPLKANETDHIPTIKYFLKRIEQAGIKTTGMIFYESSFGELFCNDQYNTLMKLSVKADK